MQLVEGFFATLTRRRLQRMAISSSSLVDLQAAINRYLGDTQNDE